MDGEGSKNLTTLWGEMLAQKSGQWKKATLQTYNKSWNVVFSRFWGSHYPKEITQAEILVFKSWYLKEFPTREPSKIKIHLKVFLDYLAVNGLISSPPDLKCLDDLVKISLRNSRRVKVGRALTPAEFDSLAEAAVFYAPEWAGSVVLLAMSTGMRKMEILDRSGFKWSPDNMMLKVWSQKNSKWREIPLKWGLSQFFGSKILNYLTIGRKFTPQAFDSHWIKIKKSAGIKGRLRFHDLRHTLASRSAEAGWSPVTACDILDMSLAVYQKIYAKPSFASKEELFNKF